MPIAKQHSSAQQKSVQRYTYASKQLTNGGEAYHVRMKCRRREAAAGEHNFIDGLHTNTAIDTFVKGKGKGVDTCYSATYLSQTRES